MTGNAYSRFDVIIPALLPGLFNCVTDLRSCRFAICSAKMAVHSCACMAPVVLAKTL